MISQHELNVLLLEAQELFEEALQEFLEELAGEQAEPVEEMPEEEGYAESISNRTRKAQPNPED